MPYDPLAGTGTVGGGITAIGGIGTTISAFKFVELQRSAYGNLTEFNREFLINWEDLAGFLKALKGGWKRSGSGYVYVTPDQCLENGFLSYFCTAATFNSYGNAVFDGTKSSWEQAIVTATYTVPEFSVTSQDIAEEDLDFSADQITVPRGTFKSPGGEIIWDPIRIVMPTCAYTITLYDQPTLPGGNALTIMNLMGYLNINTFRGADPKKMLFMGARTSRSVLAGGIDIDNNPITPQGTGRPWKIEYKFIYRPIEWTKIPINDDGKLKWIEPVDDNGKLLFDSKDFGPLKIPLF